MTAVAVEISRRPIAANRDHRTSASPAPTGVVIVADVEALAETNIGRCNDSNPYN